ncbi:MAG: aminotransferase class V-fold PLP-dependent enzyme [Candidatus Methanomethylicia archaeon]
MITFNIGSLDPHQTALILDQYGIAVRSGLHCAEPIHQIIKAENGSVRASYYLYNTEEEIDEMIKVLMDLEDIA